jgi:hypothetical protein
MPTVKSKDGTTIAYDRQGSGRALIIVDGALGSRAMGFGSELASLLASDLLRCASVHPRVGLPCAWAPESGLGTTYHCVRREGARQRPQASSRCGGIYIEGESETQDLWESAEVHRHSLHCHPARRRRLRQSEAQHSRALASADQL